MIKSGTLDYVSAALRAAKWLKTSGSLAQVGYRLYRLEMADHIRPCVPSGTLVSAICFAII
jgi:hypothetical protein